MTQQNEDVTYDLSSKGVLTITTNLPKPGGSKIVLSKAEVSKMLKHLKKQENNCLDYVRLLCCYGLIVIGIAVVCVLAIYALNSKSTNLPYITAAISATVGLVGVIAGHTAASVGKEKSEQRLADASGSKT